MRFFLHMSEKSSNFGLRHYVSPEITFAKSCKWQNKMNFICTFGFFVVILQAKLVNDMQHPNLYVIAGPNGAGS